MEVGPARITDSLPEVGGRLPVGEPGSGFANFLRSAIAQVNQDQLEADHAARQLATGEAKSIHDTMITLEKAGISMQLMMQVRNKVVEAYQEVMRMQI